MLRKVVVVGAARTPIGSMGGAISQVSAVDLGALAIGEALRRVGADLTVDEVIMGNVLQAGQGQNVARQAAFAAGLGHQIPATTVNKVCASGMKAVSMAVQAISLGDADVIVAGGTESMDMAPFLLPKARSGYRMGDGVLVDEMIKDGLFCALTDQHMGLTAEAVAEKYGITREMQDEFAQLSQAKTEAAQSEGRFDQEIVPVMVPQRRGPAIRFAKDEHPRAGVTVEKLAALRPAFKKDGTVTAGNASGINDGAAALVLTSEKTALDAGLEPLGTILAYASAGVDPLYMGMGPVPVTRKILERTGLSLEDIDLIEANEAFAATSVALERELGWDPTRVNVNGGAIALGHPIGASGARILVTLLYEMKRRSARRGLATLCVGGGMGMAVLVGR